jgi:hypothetical protein
MYTILIILKETLLKQHPDGFLELLLNQELL